MRKIDLIIVHCTATPFGQDVTTSDIDRWHRARGFTSIGYHYVVRLDGRVEQGRALKDVGAHCLGRNTTSIGIAYVGGLDAAGRPADTRNSAQRRSLQNLIADLKKRFPDANVYGHRDFAAKACPCFDAKSEYASV